MTEKKYLDFDIRFERADEGYIARVLNSPGGQAAVSYHFPFSNTELSHFWTNVGRSQNLVRKIDSPEMRTIKNFGGRLFETIFRDEVRGCLQASLHEASLQGMGLRFRLRMTDVPELLDLPWEFLYHPALNRFFSLSSETPIVRYLELPERIQSLTVKLPLQILVMISSPTNYTKLDVEVEWQRLNTALAGLKNQRLVTLDKLQEATLKNLRRSLRLNEYHIFHFIGHGGFDEYQQDGILLLENEDSSGLPVSSQYLGTLLSDHRSLRMVMLNSCQGARTSKRDPFSGTAQSLMQKGIPAVVAMQFNVSDQVAITFAKEFYETIADGCPIDFALSEARKTIYIQGNDLEWGTPVLYMRSSDERIFKISNEKPPQKFKKTDNEIFDLLYLYQIKLKILFYLSEFPFPKNDNSITKICHELGIQKRKFAVQALNDLTEDGLVDKVKNNKRVYWYISDRGKVIVRKLSEGIHSR
jgi:predicted transcriptional regulator